MIVIKKKETKKNLKESNSTPKGTRNRRTNPNVKRRKEIIKIRVERKKIKTTKQF